MAGWRDTHLYRFYLACSASAGKLATCHSASRYPGPTLLQARGTRRSPTLRPAQSGAFYTYGFVQDSQWPFSWIIVPYRHGNSAENNGGSTALCHARLQRDLGSQTL